MSWRRFGFNLRRRGPGAAWTALGILGFGALMLGAYEAVGPAAMDQLLMEGEGEGLLRAIAGGGGGAPGGFPAFLALIWRHPLILVVLVMYAAAAGTFVAREVGDGTVDLLFSRPVSRIRLALHDLAAVSTLLFGVTMLFSLTLRVIAVSLGLEPPGWSEFVVAGLLTFAFAMSILGTSYLIGSLAREGRQALGLAGGLFAALYALDVVGGIWEVVEPYRVASLFRYFAPLEALARGDELGPNLAVLFGAATAAFCLSLLALERRDL
ncbi:MAG TPA: hypothetical protein DEQ28_05230 [Clostridiales bacterium]|nr:hypothetical protein [Clostridiales bacterium]